MDQQNSSTSSVNHVHRISSMLPGNKVTLASGEPATLEGRGTSVKIVSDSLDLVNLDNIVATRFTWVPRPYSPHMLDTYIRAIKQTSFPPSFWLPLRHCSINEADIATTGNDNASVTILDNQNRILVAPPETVNVSQPIFATEQRLLHSRNNAQGSLTVIGRRRDLELELDVGQNVDVTVDSAKFRQLTIYSARTVQLAGNGRIQHVVSVGPASVAMVDVNFQILTQQRYHPQTMTFTVLAE